MIITSIPKAAVLECAGLMLLAARLAAADRIPDAPANPDTMDFFPHQALIAVARSAQRAVKGYFPVLSTDPI